MIFLLIAAMLVCSDPVAAIAAETAETESGEIIETGSEISDDAVPDGSLQGIDVLGSGIEVSANDSVGEILAGQINAKAQEQTDNNGCNIFSVSFNGQKAIIELETIEDAEVVVGTYDETTQKLVSSGKASVSAGSLSAEVTMAETLPAYFVTRAYLVGKDDLAPLCSVFETALYTRDMQEFLRKTTDDFDSELVFNYDDDKTNNFLVFNSNVVRIKKSLVSNCLASAINGNFIFTNCDEKLTGLQEGDVVSYEDDENHITLIKADSITVNGDEVTIKASEDPIDDAFDYMRINDSALGTDTGRNLDDSQLEDGVEYKGQLDKAQRDTLASGMGINLEEAGGGIQSETVAEEEAGIEFSSPYSDTFTISKTIRNSGESAEASISATVGIEIETEFKYIKTLDNSLLELKFDCALDMNVSVSGELSCEVPLGQLDIPLGKPVVNIGVTPKIVFRVSAKITAQMEFGATIGFRVENGGFSNLTGSPRIEFSLEGEVSLFAGLGLEPHIQVISDKVAAVTLEGDVGVEVSGKVLDQNTGKNSSSIHLCKVCVDGDFHFVASVKAGARFLKFEIEREITGVKKKLGDWYYSKDLNKFGLGECPNIGGTVNITVKDKKTGDPIEHADVSIVNKANASDTCPLETDKYGSTGAALKAGSYRAEVTVTGYKKYSFEFTISRTSGKEPIICLLESDGSSGGGGGGEGGNCTIVIETRYKKDNSLVGNADITIVNNADDTDIHILKSDESGRAELVLPKGNSYTATVSADGFRSTKRSIETGDASTRLVTCYLIKDGEGGSCFALSLGWNHSGAIDGTGTLWMWGNNKNGRLGDGTAISSNTPVRIMENVRFKALGLGINHSGAIDEDGNLWMWGDNSSGQLGDGTVTGKSVPEMIKEGTRFKALGLGLQHSGAIDEDGNLWMWGTNYNGVIGDGTTTSSRVPVKIMAGTKFKAVALGQSHSGAIDKDGNLWMWGKNTYGQLGDGTKTDSIVPKKIKEGVRFQTLSLGPNFSGAIDEDGNLWMWGTNTYGQLGDGTRTNTTEPKKIMEGTKFKDLALANQQHTGAVDEDGNLWMWGEGDRGALGNASTDGSIVPIKIKEGTGFGRVDLGASDSGAIDEDGNLWMWGWNFAGQLGDETNVDRHVPVKISLGGGEGSAGTVISNMEDAASAADGLLTENLAAASNVEFPAEGEYIINGNEIDFTGLESDSLYNVYSLKNKSAADPLAASNLLYIVQAESDGTGALSVKYAPKDYTGSPDIFAVKYRTPVRTVSVSGIVLSSAQLQMKKGETANLTAEVFPGDANDRMVIWESTDAGVATVDDTGTVTAVNEGMAFISATSHDGGYPVYCKVCVSGTAPTPTPAPTPDVPDPGNSDDGIEKGDLPDGKTAPDGIWVGGLKKSYPYTGNAIKPVFRVYRGNTRLAADTDYTLKYADNTRPGTATVSITMKGVYSGSKDVTFEISPASLKTEVSADTVLKAYKKNSTQRPKPVLYINGVKIKYGKDDLRFTYPSTASENGTPYRDTGTWKIHIEAKNTKLFTGEKDVDLVIVDKPLMSAVKITADKEKIPYDNGKPVSPVFSLKFRGQSLTAGSDYTIIYADDHSSIGKHKVTFAGNNKDFFGKKTYTFSVTGKYDLASALADVKLAAADLNPDGSAPYTGGGAKPKAVVKFNGKKLTAGKDYTVTYTNNKGLGSATATVKGKGRYKGSVSKTFTIVQRDINTISPDIADKVFSTKKDEYKKTTIKFVDGNYKNRKLKEGTDYTLTFKGEYDPAPAAGTQINIILEGKGNYKGKIETSYRIADKDHDLSKAKVTVNGGKAYEHTGSAIKPGVSDLKVTLNGDTLSSDSYEILGYYNNVNKGSSAYVRIRGKGIYAGVKTVKFKIIASPVEKDWSGVIQRRQGDGPVVSFWGRQGDGPVVSFFDVLSFLYQLC